MTKPLNILAITGIRSEYDILFPVLSELSTKHEVKIVVSGAHLSENHANTWQKIHQDGFVIADKIDSLLSTERLVQRAKGVGFLIQGLSQTVERVNPDFLIVVGDREESIASAIVANYHNKLLVHIGGGDPVYGNADDPIRFAVSKLAHVHCCFAKDYQNNLLNIGEEEFRVFWTGNPVYRNFDNVPIIEEKDLFSQLGIVEKKYVVLVKHPLSSEVDDSYQQMRTTLSALKLFCLKNNFLTVCIAPNSDPGSFEILKAVAEYKNQNWLHFTTTLERKYFVNLMRHASALIGNSSMGFLEAPHYKLPVVNIGNRQLGRLNAGNVRLTNYDQNEINDALEEACLNKKYSEKMRKLKNPYGDAAAPTKIRKAMESVNLDEEKWYVKKRLCP